jgi:general secretion pathway protein F
MPTFDYIAIDRAGRTRNGSLTSADAEAARRQIEGKGLVVSRLAAAGSTRATTTPRGKTRLSAKSLALLSRQLSTLVTVAPLEEALRTLRDQSENAKLRRVLGHTHEGVVEGLRLADAMGRTGAYPPTYRAMIAAGENSGALPKVMDRLADLLEKQQDARSKITAAIVYPLILSIVATFVIVALMTFVVPKVVDQFNTSGARLPPLTEAIIAVSDFMLAWGWLAATIIAALIALFAWGMQRRPFRLAVDRALLKTPLIGRLLRDVEAAGLARTLATMLSSGLPALEALQLAARTSRNAVIADAAAQMAVSVSEGSSLSSAMRRTEAFPPLLVYLTANGEGGGGGQLDNMLERAADYLEREFRTATSIALSLLEPAIIVVMGGIVCLVILSILLPILQINTMSL